MEFENIKGVARTAFKGVIADRVPAIFKGMLNELLRRDDITFEEVVTMVEKNKSLLTYLPPELEHSMHRAAELVPDIDWLTTDWFIDAIREEHKALASLFLGWEKGRNWLTRQIKAIKTEMYGS